ncbi:NADH-quinone oxidoreductase subunit M [Kibdelosporangium philippinense]|uniref:NADH-quinone oxidoreductase subunit M n=1 Tax=Kibdelosporangium philippinense TaxID=211113 RepID=A0ABS8ZSR3_9PSEU|nr:NADH-quinone oxidoreductase subunit M [Kibdelosporangium philippinense]MCE7010754.1 NADH-quinone oxidoreductase subunit M [Kibdelosporangium philippinense]
MLSLIVFLPLAVALVVLALPSKVARWLWVGVSVVDMALVVALWINYTPGAYEVNVRWIPSVSSGYHLGVDGLSLPLVALTAFLFLACAVFSFRDNDRIRSYAALFLFMQTVSLGVFVSLDLVLFFVFFDLSIVGMYFIIAGWGHRDAAKAALKFFLYTFLGSLALLLGFIGLFLAGNTFDMVELTRLDPLAGKGFLSVAVLVALGVGFAIKTPTVPFHTWLPPAHTEAPAAGSAILAGVLLKMGTYGFVRIMMPMLPDTWREYAVVFVIAGVVSVLYGALVALAQQDFKRMIAYTSVNHMGYVLLALGAFSEIGVTGAVTQMVSHGLITGALFLLSGVLYQRGRTYEMDQYGGLAGTAPRFAGLMALAAFASLGLPGFSGFIAEFQIFTGSLGEAPVATALAFLGILITATLFLRAFQRVFLGAYKSPEGKIGDVTVVEGVAIVPLIAATVVIGIFPRFLLDVIEPASRTVVELVSR